MHGETVKNNNNLLVLTTCIRSRRGCGNILHVREKQVMGQSDENLIRFHGYIKNIMC